MQISLSKSSKYLVFSEKTFTHGIESGSKMGFLELEDSSTSAESLQFAKDNADSFSFKGEPNPQGIYQVEFNA